MPKFARLQPTGAPNTVVAVDVVDVASAAALDAMFHPDLRSQFVSVPAGTVNGSTRTGSTWTHPEAPAAPPPAPAPSFRTIVSRAEYYGLFTPPEEALIRLTAAETITLAALNAATGAEKARLMAVASLAVMLNRTDALESSAKIDLTNGQVQAGLDLLAGLGLITSARKAEILKGIPT